MTDDRARLNEILRDIDVDAGSRELAGLVYDAALGEGRSQDDALDAARDALSKLRREWDDAKREDER